MIIEPKAGPTIQQPAGSTASNEAVKARVIAKLEAMKAPIAEQAAPVAAESIEVVEENRQNNSSEGNPSDAAASPAEPEKVAAAPEKPLSSEYAILARKEKALRARDQQLRSREVAIKAAEDARNAPAAKPAFDESKYISREKLQSDLFGTLSEMGLTYDQITEQAANAPSPDQVALNQELKALKDELKAIRGEQEASKKSWEDNQTQSYKQAVNDIKREASLLISHDPNFETIKETGSLDDVVELIERTFKEDGTLLTVEEAANEVENYLVEEALKISRIKKIQQRLNASAAASAPVPAKPTDAPKQQQMKTLTNSVSSTRQLSARERAILAAQRK